MICRNCGKTFDNFRRVTGSGRSCFCSNTCYNHWYYQQYVKPKRRSGEQHACIVCGKPTFGYHHRYCSRACREAVTAYQPKPLQTRICPICGTEFSTRISRKIYCKRTHGVIAGNARARARKLKEMTC